MEEDLSSSARRVQETLRALGFSHHVVELAQSTRTAAEAARAVGCEVGQIAKSLVFKGTVTGRGILVMADGASRVDERTLGMAVEEPVERADPDFVRERTGFAIGGVPPVGHREPLEVLLDRGLLSHSTIWAAAGTPRAVFRLTPQELLEMTSARLVDVTRSQVVPPAGDS